MREIKFRAFDSRNNEMVYSDKEDAFYINTKGAMFMYAIPKSESGLETIYHKSYDVMQYTGLKDKNGVDIYEGDIVYISGIGNLSVVFKLASWCFEDEYHLIQFSECEDIEGIVGNIYENPELVNNQ